MGWGLLIFYVTNETNETNVRPPKSPLKPIKGSLKGRYSPDWSGLKIRHLRRPRAPNHTLSVRPPKSPLKPIKGSLKGRYSPDGSGLKIHPPVIIGRTCPTTCQKM